MRCYEQPGDYTRLGNEVKTGARRSAMRNQRIRGFGVLLLAASGLMVCGAGPSCAQENAAQRPDSPKEDSTRPDSPKTGTAGGVGPPISGKQLDAVPERAHRFWDRENDWLFAGVGASRTLDYFSTLNMRRRGRQEIFLTNDAVDNHAAFAAIEASATGVSIGAAYLFHRYGHHKLERWTSIVHIGLATTGSVRNYCLQTAHFAKTPGAP
jgi:hypothetical protein